MLNWFPKASSNLKFKYDFFDFVWVDVDTFICIVQLTYTPLSKIHSLDSNDFNLFKELFLNKNERLLLVNLTYLNRCLNGDCAMIIL